MWEKVKDNIIKHGTIYSVEGFMPSQEDMRNIVEGIDSNAVIYKMGEQLMEFRDGEFHKSCGFWPGTRPPLLDNYTGWCIEQFEEGELIDLRKVRPHWLIRRADPCLYFTAGGQSKPEIKWAYDEESYKEIYGSDDYNKSRISWSSVVRRRTRWISNLAVRARAATGDSKKAYRAHHDTD